LVHGATLVMTILFRPNVWISAWTLAWTPVRTGVFLFASFGEPDNRPPSREAVRR
jgi:hypothetical protein